VVILASPKTLAHSLKLRLVVMMTLVRSYSLLRRWKSSAPPEALNGRYPSSSITRQAHAKHAAERAVSPSQF
jgi:predicted lysophospholipase L1 biosynthesis ABC-type transport system permease subunit